MSLENNLNKIKSKIEISAKKSGRSASDIEILAVTKTWPAEKVRQAYALGLRHFGENYIQEALPKLNELSDLKDINWHFIGHLQSNKIKNILGKFKYIHSVDRPSLIQELNKKLVEPQDILLEVQFIKEEQKSGAVLEDVPKLLDLIQSTKKLRLCGLMVMPPLKASENEKRRIFSKARQLASSHSLSVLSMGTSDDFELAIEEGSTLVRLGTVLFGERT